MSLPDASARVLRPGVLDGVRIVLAGPPDAAAEPGAAIAAGCAAAGGRVAACRPASDPDVEAHEAAMEAAVAAALADLGGADMLVVDGAGLLADGSLGACMQAAWDAARAVATQAFIGGDAVPGAGRAQGEDSRAGGRIVLVAPACSDDRTVPDDGAHAAAALAGLENLARTLSIEWARHRVTCVAVAPGPRTQPAQLAELVGYLASPAGAYFSGCLLDLRGQTG